MLTPKMAARIWKCRTQFWQLCGKGIAAMTNLKLELTNMYGKGRFFCQTCTHNEDSTEGVDQASLNRYKRDGVICIRNYFDQYWLDLVKEGIEKNLNNPSRYRDWLIGEDGKGLYFNDLMNWKNIKEFTEFVWKSPAARLAGTLMESKISVFFHDHVFVKHGGTYHAAPWHHDQAYYPLDGMQNCSIWMPVTPVSKDTCLKFIRGSHLWGKWFHSKKFGTHFNYDSSGQKTERTYEEIPDIKENGEYDILSWELEPGDCLVFHMKTLHGTDKSTSDIPRLVLATRWVGEDATYAERPWETSPARETMPEGIKVGDHFHKSGFPTIWTRTM